MRVTTFLERKNRTLSRTVLPPVNISPKMKPLSIETLPQVDVPPFSKPLALSALTFVSIPPTQRILSRYNQLALELVPGIINEDEDTISTYIDGYTHRTIFFCKLCWSDHFQSTQAIKKHLREVHKISTRPSLNYHFEPRFEDVR